MDAKDNPSTPSQAWNNMSPALEMIDAILDGPAAVRSKGKAFLPPYAAEAKQPGEYARRLASAPWQPEFEDILRTLASKPFGEPVAVVKGDTPRLKALVADIDGRGNDITAFTRPVFEGGLAKGCAAILVDNTGKGTARTQADETAESVRPYWIAVDFRSIIDLKTAFVGGREQPYHVRITETALERDGYAEVVLERIRELNREAIRGSRGNIVALGPPTWRLHEKRTGASGEEVWVEIDNGQFAPVKEIPLALFWTGRRKGAHEVQPPLYGVADKQMELYRALSKQEEVLTYASAPMLALMGVAASKSGEQPVVGPKTVITLPADGDAKYVQPEAEVLKEHRMQIETLTNTIRRLGMQPLTQRSGGVTATENVLEAAKANSAVEAWTIGLKDVLEQAFRFTNEYLAATEPVEVKVTTDFGVEPYSAPALQELREARKAREISRPAYISGLRRFSVLEPDFDIDADEELIAEEMQGLEGEDGLPPALDGAPAQSEAARQLDEAIALHEQHMNGSAPTTGPAGERSQQLMMDQMVAARRALGGGATMKM